MHYELCIASIAQQDSVNCSNVGGGDDVVASLVTVDYLAVVIVEQHVIECCDVGSGYLAIAVHVARNHIIR